MSDISNIVQDIDRAHEKMDKRDRYHLGCSQVGHHCERFVWFGHRWALPLDTPGRVLRLFRRGRLEEETILQDLEIVGFSVVNQQAPIDLGSHLAGSTDGEIEINGEVVLLECKTHSLKSFKELVSKGVKSSKLQHWVQMQLYMMGRGLQKALYYAVCKDNDEIYTEMVSYDQTEATQRASQARALAVLETAPPRISERPGWWMCKMCSAHDLCHGSRLSREVNCRTCSNVTPTKEGNWFCERWGAEVPNEHQEKGCPSHVLHPDLVPWERESVGEQWHAAYNGRINGGPELDGAKSSKELLNETP